MLAQCWLRAAPVARPPAGPGCSLLAMTPAALTSGFGRSPRPQTLPPKPYTHPAARRFDGDGMLHAVRIAGGAASYSNHWVRTKRLDAEQAAGWPLFMKVRRAPEGGGGAVRSAWGHHTRGARA